MGDIARYLPGPTGLVPLMDQAAAGEAEGGFQLGVVAQGGVAAQAGGVQQLGVQLPEQLLAPGEELGGFEWPCWR